MKTTSLLSAAILALPLFGSLTLAAVRALMPHPTTSRPRSDGE